MAAGEETSQTNPIVANSAPRLRLVHMGKGEARKIPCRRVVTLLGSRQGCKVALQHRGVSGAHLAIVNDGSHILAVDLVTKLGTLLNGLKMEHERLNDGDCVAIPPWEFRVEIQEPKYHGESDVHPFGLDPSPHVAALEHTDSSRILRPNRDLCVIGRRNGCDIVLSDSSVSRVHALLLNYYGHPAIFDLLSANHVLINDQPVQFHILEDGEIVAIGDSKFRVRLMDSGVVERAANGRPSATTEAAEAPSDNNRPPDLIDIKKTESSQAWRIADNLEKATRKR